MQFAGAIQESKEHLAFLLNCNYNTIEYIFSCYAMFSNSTLLTFKFCLKCLKITNCLKLQTVGKTLECELTKLADAHTEANFFLDETSIGGPWGLSANFLITFSSERIEKNVFLWIACNYKKPLPMDQEKLKSGKLIIILRN
jgi:hypothetical protein